MSRKKAIEKLGARIKLSPTKRANGIIKNYEKEMKQAVEKMVKTYPTVKIEGSKANQILTFQLKELSINTVNKLKKENIYTNKRVHKVINFWMGLWGKAKFEKK